MSDLKVPLANVATHNVSGDWPEGSRYFFRNPANGAVEVRPACRDKVARSLNHQARKMKRRLRFLQARLFIEYIALKVWHRALVMSRELLCLQKKTICNAHDIPRLNENPKKSICWTACKS